jgi:hypothetical protein
VFAIPAGLTAAPNFRIKVLTEGGSKTMAPFAPCQRPYNQKLTRETVNSTGACEKTERTHFQWILQQKQILVPGLERKKPIWSAFAQAGLELSVAGNGS